MVGFSSQFWYLICLNAILPFDNFLLVFDTTANRVVEVNEMWRLRDKQLELDNKLKGIRNVSNSRRGYKDICESRTSTSREGNEIDNCASANLSSKKRPVEGFDPMEDEGLKDDEIDQFLQSRFVRSFMVFWIFFLCSLLFHVLIALSFQLQSQARQGFSWIKDG